MRLLSLSRLAAHWADKKPDAPALSDEETILTWSQLEAHSNRLARAYAEQGVGADDFVSIALPNGVEFIIAVFAVWKLGATPQPLPPRLTPAESEHLLKLVNPKLVLGGDGGNVPSRWLPERYEPPASTDSSALPEKTARSMRAMASGGSTGTPKLIVSLRPATCDLDDATPGFCNEGTMLTAGPLYHQGPFVWGLLAMMRGSRMNVMRRFDAEETLARIARHSADSTCLVPTMMQRMWMLSGDIKAKYDVSSMRNLWHLGAPCAPWLKRAFIDWFGAAHVWELYGASEGLGLTMIRGDEWLQHPGSVGRPAASCQMKVVDDSGAILPANTQGEIFIRPITGAGTTYRYVGAQSRRLGDGWESLGDIGYLDDDGYLYIVDRRTDMILCGGANVYPAEIEAAIDSYGGVRSSAVIGLPHEDLGNRIHAIVDAPGKDVTEKDLLEYLTTRLSRSKLPHSIEFVADSLRDEAGKVRRSALRSVRLASARTDV